MSTITIPKKEYTQLKQRSAAYTKIVEEIMKAEQEYPYDHKYIDRLTRRAKKGGWIEAKSVDGALARTRKQ